MQDIAGVRIVEDMTLDAQNRLVARVGMVLPNASVIDR
jgi:hypothetical protein